jgi:hypothetical protein
MYVLMRLQIALLIEWFITYITTKWPLPLCMRWYLRRVPFSQNDLLHTSQLNGHSPLRMHWCVFTWLLNKWLITYITAKWPFPTMYEQMLHQSTLLTEWLITHNKMATPQHVCADLSSEYCDDWVTQDIKNCPHVKRTLYECLFWIKVIKVQFPRPLNHGFTNYVYTNKNWILPAQSALPELTYIVE